MSNSSNNEFIPDRRYNKKETDFPSMGSEFPMIPQEEPRVFFGPKEKGHLPDIDDFDEKIGRAHV